MKPKQIIGVAIDELFITFSSSPMDDSRSSVGEDQEQEGLETVNAACLADLPPLIWYRCSPSNHQGTGELVWTARPREDENDCIGLVGGSTALLILLMNCFAVLEFRYIYRASYYLNMNHNVMSGIQRIL